MARLASLLPYHYIHLSHNLLKNITGMTSMRQQRVWDFFQGWLPLSTLPMILPFSTNQQPLRKEKRENIFHFSFLVSLGPVVVIYILKNQTQNYTTSVSLFLQSVSFMALETHKKAVMITFFNSGLSSWAWRRSNPYLGVAIQYGCDR